MKENLEYAFLRDLESSWLEELRKELFFVSSKKTSSALRFVSLELSDSKEQLGKWDSALRCVSISRFLVRNFPWECVVGVLYHELAHAYVSLVLNVPTSPHGEVFQHACKVLNVPPHFRTPTIDVSDPGNLKGWRSESVGTSNDHALLRKAEKLSQLTQSSNQHEAELALERLQKLRQAFNFQRALANEKNNFVKIQLRPRKKALSKVYKKIGSILNEFYGVNIVYDAEYCAATLETYKTIALLGARHEVLFAEYVYFSLLQQMEMFATHFAKQHKKKLAQGTLLKTNLHTSEKLSLDTFKYGLLVGYAGKLRSLEKAAAQKRQADDNPSAENLTGEGAGNGCQSQMHSHANTVSEKNTLMLVDSYEKKKEKELANFVVDHYPNLRTSSKSTTISNASSYHAGVAAGANVTVHKPVSSSQSGKFLT